MSRQLTHIEVHNFRSLADVRVETDDLNVFFGPNGSGKSTLLDAIWLVRDCADRGVDMASSYRNYGLGALWDKADEGTGISIELGTNSLEYRIELGYSAGRIDPFAGERLYAKDPDISLIEREIGSKRVDFYHSERRQTISLTLREPKRLAFTRYLSFDGGLQPFASELDELLHSVNFYYSRGADFDKLGKFGSESSHQVRLREHGQNLWSVLRNLHDRRGVDNRYDTIVRFMRKSFPGFNDLLIEQTGPNTVYGNFIEKGHRQPILASDVSDGHLQMLILLTFMFSEGQDSPSLILFDEPDVSLHPYALAVFAQAVRLAAEEWNRQVFIATHSPVLISQFAPKDILAAEIGEFGQAVIRRVSEIERVQDLLEEYATGSLYMAEIIAPQSRIEFEEESV